VRGQLLRFSTHWPIAVWWPVGPLSGVNSGADAPTIWKKLACPGVMRKPRPLSRSGTSTAVPPRRVRLRRCLLSNEPGRCPPGSAGSRSSRYRLRGAVAARSVCPPDRTLLIFPFTACRTHFASILDTPHPFQQVLETIRAWHATILVNHSSTGRQEASNLTERFQPDSSRALADAGGRGQ